MNELIRANNHNIISKESLITLLYNIDSKDLITLASMAFLSTTICIGAVCISKSEMKLSKEGLTITQPS